MNNEHSGTLNISFKIKGTFEIFWNNLTVIVSLILSRVPIWSFWHFKNFIKWLRDPNISQRFRLSKIGEIRKILMLGKFIYVGWILRFLRCWCSVDRIPIWKAQIVKLQKSFEIIPNSNQFPGVNPFF